MGLSVPLSSHGPSEEEQSLSWPALESVRVDGWVLRFSRGVTRRANSVLPLEEPSDLDEAVHEVERRYRARGLVPTFQVGASARPSDLRQRLLRRAYVGVSSTTVLGAGAADVLAGADDPPDGVVISATGSPDDDWVRTWAGIDGPATWDEARVAAAVMAGVPSRYLRAQTGGGGTRSTGSSGGPDGPAPDPVVGVVRATRLGSSVALACLAVRVDARRRGVGRALLVAAVRSSAADHAWLQVLRDNRGAGSLYEGLGFREVGGYSYLVAG